MDDPTTMPRGATIYDVALLAGVSASTVSRAYSRPGRVAAATSERVLAAAARLGYRTDVVAAPAGGGKLVAFVVPDASSSFDSELVHEMGVCAARAGFSLAVVLGTEGDEVGERVRLERALPAVGGVVLSAPTVSDSAIRVIAKQRPTVVLNRWVADVPSVLRDNVNGMRLAVEHLAGLGHHDVTYVAGPESSWADGVRWRSIRKAALESDMSTRRIGPSRAVVASGVRAAEELLAQRVSAVIAFNDVLALGVVRGLAARGCRVPADVSVVGFDNIGLASVVAPSLTTVAVSVQAVCASATATLVKLMRGQASLVDAVDMLVPARLVVRESTAQRRRKSTSPALGTTRVSGSDSYWARSKSSLAM